MSLTARLTERFAAENLKGVERARKAVSFALSRRDRHLPLLAETRNLEVEGAAGPLPARLYVPRGAESPGPLLLFFHGGGFILGDIETHDAFCVRLADAAAVRVLSCRYRLAPEAAFPAQLNDAIAATRWTLANLERLGGDRLAMGGDSAGGYLTVAATREIHRENSSAVCAHVLVYPLLSMDDAVWASTLFQDARIVGRLAVQFIRAQLGTSEGHSLLTPLLPEAFAAAPPTVIVAGDQLDPCRPEAAVYAERLREVGVPVEERYFALQPHGFINLTHLSQASRDAVREIGTLTGALLKGSTPSMSASR
jgi:acetyl esterase